MPEFAAVRHRLGALQNHSQSARADDGARDEATERNQRADGFQVSLLGVDSEGSHFVSGSFHGKKTTERIGVKVRLLGDVHQARPEAEQRWSNGLHGSDDSRMRS